MEYPENEHPTEPVGSLYAILGIPRDASPSRLRKAFRARAAAVHPDKHGSTNQGGDDAADAAFRRVRNAYEVLSDPSRRAVYDAAGTSGLQLLNTSPVYSSSTSNSAAEALEELRRLKELQERQKLEARVNHRGVYSFSFSAADAVLGRGAWAPKRSGGPRHRHSPPDSRPSPLELRGVQMNSSLHAPLSLKDTVTMGGSMAARGGRGGGNLAVGLQRQCSDRAQIELAANIGPNSSLSLSAVRQLTGHTTANIDWVWAPHGLALGLAISRQLSETWTGKVEYVFSPAGGITVSADRKGEKTKTKFEVTVGLQSSVSADLTRKVGSGSYLRAAAKLGTHAMQVEAGAGSALSSNSSAGFTLVVGLQGIYWRFRFTRAGQRFIFPILICPTLNRKVLLVSVILPPVVAVLTHRLVLKPQAKRRKDRKEREMRRRYRDEVKEGLEKAAGEVRLLESTVERNVERERNKEPPGLVIEAAFFGDPDAITRAEVSRETSQSCNGPSSQTPSGSASSSTPQEPDNQAGAQQVPEAGVGSQVLEVRAALQFLVEDSKLELPEGVSCVGMMGFCDPCPWAQTKELSVHYSFAGQPYKTRIKDCEALQIPQRSHSLHR